MIHVLAIITTKPGKRDEVLRAAHAVTPIVLAEKGCIEYGPAVDAEGAGPVQAKLGPDTYMVIEKWETLADLAAHGASPHMAAFSAKVKDLLAGRAIHILSPG